MRQAILTAGWLVYACNIAVSQEQLSFEVASVKPSGPKSIRGSDGGPGSRDPGRYSFGRATLHDLLYEAYDLVDDQQILGPDWLGSEEYDLVAKIPPGTTKKQFEKMMQNLLVERFKLVLHHETRNFPVYVLIVGKSGPKLKESGASAASTPTPATPNPIQCPELPPDRPGLSTRHSLAGACMVARRQPMSEVADMLHMSVRRVVVDQTGLTGKYDFTLRFVEPLAGAATSGTGLLDGASDPGLTLSGALERELGLKLEEKKMPYDVLVIESAQKAPTENF
jgi:uncharacterized protein (TIGR03435 family)